MSYGDYGAYVWKNKENITKQCADKVYYLTDKIKNKWVDLILLPENFDDTNVTNTVEGHAVLRLGDMFISFYKTYDPIVTFKNGDKENLKLEEYKDYKFEEFIINKRYLNSNKNIVEFEIKHRSDCYCIICGSAVGNWYDNNKTSKFIRKYNVFSDKRHLYYFDSKFIGATSEIEVFNKLERIDEIKFTKYLRWQYGIKIFLKKFFHFKFDDCLYYLNEIQQYNYKIKILK